MCLFGLMKMTPFLGALAQRDPFGTSNGSYQPYHYDPSQKNILPITRNRRLNVLAKIHCAHSVLM